MIFPKQKTTNNVDPFAKPRLVYIYGQKGSGKTTLLVNLLMLLEKSADIDPDDSLFVTGNNRDPLLKALSFKVTDSPTDLDDFILKAKNNTDSKKKYLLILDDLQSSPQYKIMSGRSDFLNFVLSSRHYGGGVYIFVTSQAWSNSFSPILKGNVDMFFLFQPKGAKETKSLEEFFDDSEKIKKALKLLKLTNMENEKKNNPRTFLYINKTGSDDKYFLGFKNELTEL